MLFSDQRSHSLSVPARDKQGKPSTVAYLIEYLCDNVMKDPRKELFVLDENLCVPNPSLKMTSTRGSFLVTFAY
jgi:hypothetical protein